MLDKILPKNIQIFLLAIWVIYAVDLVLPMFNFNVFGIRPRELSGLWGILFSPFLHANLGHIISNSIALVGTSILLRFAIVSDKLPWVLMFCAVFSGIGVWLFSTAGVVVGASGVIYGLIGYLFANAYFNPSIKSWAIALVSLAGFGGAVLSLFTFSPFVSWSGHFWGFVAGVVFASFNKSE